jgi:hypothetical protein
MSLSGISLLPYNGPILNRLPAISRTVTQRNPIGLGRSRDRVASARCFKRKRIDPIGLSRISGELVLLFVVDFTAANRIDLAAENDQIVANINLASEADDRGWPSLI